MKEYRTECKDKDKDNKKDDKKNRNYFKKFILFTNNISVSNRVVPHRLIPL